MRRNDRSKRKPPQNFHYQQAINTTRHQTEPNTLSISKLDTMTLHRDLTTPITSPLLLILLLPEPRPTRDDQVPVRPFAIVVLRASLPVISIILQTVIGEFDLVGLDPRERNVRFLWFFVVLPVLVSGGGTRCRPIVGRHGGGHGRAALVRAAFLSDGSLFIL